MLKKFGALFITLCLAIIPTWAQAKLILADTDDTVRVVTASGVSTIHMYAAWADITTTALTPGASDAQVTTATTTVLVAAPAASTQRQLKGLYIRNSHASSSNAITVEFYDGATATELIKYTLLAGETLQWGEDIGFRVTDASGQVKGAVVADTEMPAAAALADNTANPTVPAVAAFIMCYDGSTWDRCQGGLTDTDDGSIPASQVPNLGIALDYVYSGTAWVRNVVDPCSRLAKTHIAINISTATTTELTSALAGASTYYYVCSIDLVTAGANNVALVDDDTDGCGSPTAGLAGGTTAASGWNFAANGGMAKGNGTGTVFKAVTANSVLCLVTSAATQLSGSIQVVAAP